MHPSLRSNSPWQELQNLFKSPWTWILLGAILVAGVFFALDRAGSAHTGSDFHMYYSSGQHFQTGKTLYQNPDSGAPYTYPPFAAFCFQALGVFAEGTCIAIGFYFNLLLSIAILFLVYLIGRRLNWPSKRLLLAGLGALILSVEDFWNNINFSQINTFIFFLILLGIWFYLEEKHHLAMICWSFGAWIKVLPVFFIVWGLIRRFKWSSVLVVGGVSLICIGLPVLQRGWEMGLADHIGYYEDFLHTNTSGVNVIWRNQSLSSALTRTFWPESSRVYQDVYWSGSVVKNVPGWIKMANWSVLILTLGTLIFARVKKRKITFLELAGFWLSIHLVSGITWRGHLLTLVFILVPLFRKLPWKKRIGHQLIGFGLLLGLFAGLLFPFRSIDRALFMNLYEANLLAWVLLLLWAAWMVQMLRNILTEKEWNWWMKT